MYTPIIKGTAANLSNKNSISDRMMNPILNLFSLLSNCLNLSENSGISETKSALMSTQNMAKTWGC